jgi:hypothetical protein
MEADMSGIRNFASSLALTAAATLALVAAAPAHAQAGRLTVQQLGDTLTSYGKNTVNDNGHTYYTVRCGNGNWKSSVVVSLSPSENVVWLTIDVSTLPQAKISPQALGNLLLKNEDIGPMFFSLNGDRKLRLNYPVANVGLTEAKVKADVKELVDLAVDTMSLWDPNTLVASK